MKKMNKRKQSLYISAVHSDEGCQLSKSTANFREKYSVFNIKSDSGNDFSDK